jgi:hypothetical protein
MIYRLLARYRKNPAPSELLPKREGRTAGVGMLVDEVEAVIQELIVGYYLKRQRPRVVDLYRQIALSCRTRSLPPPSYDPQFAYFALRKISITIEVNTCDLAGSPLLLQSARFTSHHWLHAVPLTHPTPLPMGTTGRRIAACTARRAGALLIAVTVRLPSHNLSSLLRVLSVYCAPLLQAIESLTWEIGSFPAKAWFCSSRMPLGR